MYIPVVIDDELTLRVPQFFCCNCGGVLGIRPVTTSLSAARNWRARRTILLQLPYCERCAMSAGRRTVGIAPKILIAAILAVALALIVAVVPLPGATPRFIDDYISYITAVLVFAGAMGLYSLQKARGKQSSYYQPVQLNSASFDAAGRVVGLVLTFSNARYGETFAAANPAPLSNGALRVRTI